MKEAFLDRHLCASLFVLGSEELRCDKQTTGHLQLTT
jgi:hypothetical protein